MTTIAYRDGVLAADGRVTDGGHLIITDECQKIRRLSDGSLFALAGDVTHEQKIIECLEDMDVSLPQGKDFTAILVDTDGLLSTYEGSGDRFYPWYERGFAAFGSGSEIAYGAMEMGATAAEAVSCAALRNTTTGGAIQTERPGIIEIED